MIIQSPHTYGQRATNRIAQARDRGIEGARALLDASTANSQKARRCCRSESAPRALSSG